MKLSKTSKARLTKLIKHMESLPRSANKHFDMEFWFFHGGDHSHAIGPYVAPGALEHCGTTACALGWAATIPSFKKAGLKIRTIMKGPQPMTSGRRFFGLTHSQFDEMFGFSSVHDNRDIKTPKQWAKRARMLIDNWETAP